MAQKQTKTAFVLSMPSASAKEVVEAAKKRGMKLSAAYVNTIRSNARRKAKSPGGRKGAGGAESALRSAIAELGLARSRIVLDEVERAFR
jgi:hypothetical protein